MSANTDLRWLKPSELKGAARRFAEFCKTDIKHQSKINKDFDIETYDRAARLIISKLKAPGEPHKKDDA
ncbi:hypothetical protein [Leucothrix pacifica]|uniref:Uncharacterized protein n=1 Tax=Leucothrix pacifica TaxID=1247513 RepID=A0A317CMF1_9GAMM|nr:hypothetical protein [Leucothrix pacifica]PWQ99795.1 hypothetical protein DKW60_04795 [Leucothrix pacifica]